MPQSLLLSFCNIPTQTTSPLMCLQVPDETNHPVSFAPVSLGYPDLTFTATGLTSVGEKIFVLFMSRSNKFHVAVLQKKSLLPLSYQELSEIKDGHSILAVNDYLYVVSTGTDEVIRYEIQENGLENPKIIWRASNTKTDTHHINSIVEKNGDLLVSAFGPKKGQLWATASNGYIYNITTNSIVANELYHPHSLTVSNGEIYYSDSHRSSFCVVGQPNSIFSLAGYTRGIAWLPNGLVCMATSIGRKVSKSTGLIANSADPGEPAGECNLFLGNVFEKNILRKIDLAWFGPEVYDVLVLQEEPQTDLLALSNISQKSERDAIQILSKEAQILTAQAKTLSDQVQTLSDQVQTLSDQVQTLSAKEVALNTILQSRSWKFIQFLQRLRLKISPHGSYQEQLLRLLWRSLHLIRSQGLISFLRAAMSYIRNKIFQNSRWASSRGGMRRGDLKKYRSIPRLPLTLQEKARKIEASGFFDHQWYLDDNPDVFEAGINPIEHYLVNGSIENDRNPNPLFNTTIYAEAFGLQQEDALLHFVDSGRLFAPGAYRSADILMAAQKNYQRDLDIRLLQDSRIGNKRYAVFFQCGSGSIHHKWMGGSKRNWDLVVNHYDTTYTNKMACDVEFAQVGKRPGTKFTAFNQLLTSWSSVLSPYQYILLLDDDILVTEADINRLFSIAEEQQLDLAQASLSADSYSAHPILKNSGKGGLRYISGVEIMMPIISQQVLKRGGYLFNHTISGWGIDFVIGRYAQRIAVVDDIIAKHVKPIDVNGGAFYKMLQQAFIYPQIELMHFQRIYKVGRSFHSISPS